MEDSLMIIIAGILIIIALFFTLRELFLWYYKINEIVYNQKNTNRLLQKILNHRTTGKIYGDVEGDIIVENQLTGKITGMTSEQFEKRSESQKKFLIILKK